MPAMPLLSCTPLPAADTAGRQGHRGLLHVAQDAFYRNLTADEARDIASFNFDHPSVSVCAGSCPCCSLRLWLIAWGALAGVCIRGDICDAARPEERSLSSGPYL